MSGVAELMHAGSWLTQQSVFAALLSAVALVSLIVVLNATQKPYPPGPRGLPIIGNILQFPTKSAWLKLLPWKKQYGASHFISAASQPCLLLIMLWTGDLVFFHGFGQHILVLNSEAAIADLLEQRATIYSHRPRSIVAGEMMGLGNVSVKLDYP